MPTKMVESGDNLIYPIITKTPSTRLAVIPNNKKKVRSKPKSKARKSVKKSTIIKGLNK